MHFHAMYRTSLYRFFLQVLNQKCDEAKKSLKWLRGTNFDVDFEVQKIKEFQSIQKHSSWKILFTERINLKALFITLGLVTSFQMSGVGAIMMYTAGIFEVSDIQYQNL